MAKTPHVQLWPLFAALALLTLAAVAPATSGAPQPTNVPPFAFPILEGPQVKMEIGQNAPSGPATSFWGNSPAMVNFSVWWWDAGPPSSPLLFLDGIAHPMSAAPGGDGQDLNGTLYVVRIDPTTLAQGGHSYYFAFAGPNGNARLPTVGNFTKLELAPADRFLSSSLKTAAAQLAAGKRSGTYATLRDVLDRAMTVLDPLMGTDWNATDGYPYTDPNHYIITPSGLTATDLEAFVASNGANRARYADGLAVANNSQVAIKQALVLRGVLLATGLFNSTEIELRTESFVMNGTNYAHPFLRVNLLDGSEQPGDGTVDGDGLIDLDLWAMGAPINLTLGKHFQDDGAMGNDTLWDGSTSPPPSPDPYSVYALWPYDSAFFVNTPDGTNLSFFVVSSAITIETTTPRNYDTAWFDEPVVFDALASRQSSSLDLVYSWRIENTLLIGNGPIWFQYAPRLDTFTVDLTVSDPFGHEDSLSIPFVVHGKTRERQIPDQTFLEDSDRLINLQQYFADDDGFWTINFTISSDPVAYLNATPQPYPSPFVDLTAAQDWCGNGTVTIVATDGSSPRVGQTFNVTVQCQNDAPVLFGIPGNFTFDEDTALVYHGLSTHMRDVDGDILTVSFAGNIAQGTYSPSTDDLTVTAPLNWNGIDSTLLTVSDGSLTASAAITVKVIAVNDPPYLIAPIAPFIVLEDSANISVFLSEWFADPDGDPLLATATPGVGLDAGFNDASKEFWFHPMANFSGVTSFQVRARDSLGAFLDVVVAVTVVAVNDPPQITAASPSGYVAATEGDKLSFSVQATDSDSPSLLFEYMLDGVPQGSSFLGTFEWQTGFASAGSHTMEVNASDGAGGNTVFRWQILVVDKNRAPTVIIRQSGNGSYGTGAPINLTAVGTDPDGDSLTYSWTFGGALQPLNGANANISFHAEGDYEVRVTANDGHATATNTISVHIVYVAPVEPVPNGTNPQPTYSGFIPSAGAAAGLGAMAAAAVLLIARRRR